MYLYGPKLCPFSYQKRTTYRATLVIIRRLIPLLLILLSAHLAQSAEYHLVKNSDFHKTSNGVDTVYYSKDGNYFIFINSTVYIISPNDPLLQGKIDSTAIRIIDMTTKAFSDSLHAKRPDSLRTELPDTIVIPKFVMGLKNNMLADVALIPNIGVEFYIDRGFTVGLNWMYAWWDSDRKQWSWRLNGGELNARMYLGKLAKKMPLQGHHVGIYAQVYTYDFAWKGKGLLGGESGGHFFDRVNYGFGVEYGYSLPIYTCLNLDFTLGLGYFGGLYEDYIFEDECYAWQATKQRHFFGPTKAEVSLVWRIDGKTLRDNKQTGGYRATILPITKGEEKEEEKEGDMEVGIEATVEVEKNEEEVVEVVEEEEAVEVEENEGAAVEVAEEVEEEAAEVVEEVADETEEEAKGGQK